MKTIRKIFVSIVTILMLFIPTLSNAVAYQNNRDMLGDFNYLAGVNEENLTSLMLRDTVKAKPNTAVVMKYEEDTENPLPGSKITLYNAQKEKIGSAVTNRKGKVDFADVTDLVPGTYYYKETKAPVGYKVNNTEYSFVVDNEGNVQFSEAALQGEVVKTEVPEGYIGIYTSQDLNNIRNNLAGKYILMNDLDMTSIANFEPIGDYTNKFTGILDGNYKKISNLKINSSKPCVGLFEYIFNTAQVKNLELYNVNAKSTYVLEGNNGSLGTLGTLAGSSSGTIKNVKITGNSQLEIAEAAKSFGTIGGLVGGDSGDIEKCSTTIKIEITD